MRFRVTAAALVAAVLPLGAGCAASTPVTHYRSFAAPSDFHFRYPSSWAHVSLSCLVGTMDSPIVQLTTAPATPVCGHRQKPAAQARRLGDNGLSVVWGEWGWPGFDQRWQRDKSPVTRVGGQPARTSIAMRGTRAWKTSACSGVGGNLAMETTILSPDAADNYYSMTACLRGPSLAANKQAVRAMLASVRFHRSS